MNDDDLTDTETLMYFITYIFTSKKGNDLYKVKLGTLQLQYVQPWVSLQV